MTYLFWIVVFIINTIIITCLLDGLIIGFAMPVKRRQYKREFMLKTPNRFDYQGGTECSGFSSAYVLRSFGIEADGREVYAGIPHKIPGGAVLPSVLSKELGKYGLKARYVKGNLETLKTDLSEGKRIIVFIRTRTDKRWLHYVPIVGYDEDNVYIAESMNSLVNCEGAHSNRRLSNEEFLKFWDTRELYMPFYRNTYLVIEKI